MNKSNKNYSFINVYYDTYNMTYLLHIKYLKIFNKTNEYSMNKSFLKCFNRCICNTIRYSYTLMNAIEIEETSVNYCATYIGFEKNFNSKCRHKSRNGKR